jgi:hypothetical protein
VKSDKRGAMETDWASELEAWLQDRFTELCEAIGQPVPHYGLRINPPLGLEESKYFLLGLEAGLFRPDEFGFVQSELFSSSSTGQAMCQIFWHDPPRLFREGVCQLSTAASLIMNRGWLKSHILMEPDCKDGRDMSYGMDILVRAPAGQILACVEIKRSVAELQKLITDLRACCKRGAHAKDDCGFPQNHPKYEFCASYKPTYFWAVAPDAEVCFRMKYGGGSIELEQLISLPPRSMIEST